MPKPPIDPDSFDKVNFVIDSWTTGCDAPWYIYVETMKPAALTAFFALLEFGLGDVVRGIFRPKGLGRRTGKRKGKWLRRLPAFPEIGNTIGRQIGSVTGATGYTRWKAAGRTLWRIDLAMQSALLLWLVADIAEDFVFNWTSLLYESYWCQDDPPGGFSYHSETWGTMGSNGWKRQWYGWLDWERGAPGWGFGSGSTGNRPATIVACNSFKAFPPLDPPDSVRIIVQDRDNGQIYCDSGTNTEIGPDKTDAIAVGVIPPNTRFMVWGWMTGPDWCKVGFGAVIGIELDT